MRGSALESLDRSSRRRPSRGCPLRSFGKETENCGVDGGVGSARRNSGTMAVARRMTISSCNDRRDAALQIFICRVLLQERLWAWSDGESQRREEEYCLLAKRFENNLDLRWELRAAPSTPRGKLREESGCNPLAPLAGCSPAVSPCRGGACPGLAPPA